MLLRSRERRADMLARAAEGTKVSLLEDMLRLASCGRWKLGRMVSEVLDRSSTSTLNCRPDICNTEIRGAP